ncbi:MAG: sigma factor-like helix-turn-helix DNA-binding protein [Actinomycetota bacterium]|nr:sigma factor-like helix-turn-helix DNA-binding protein [Actinomycetota bacterium]
MTVVDACPRCTDGWLGGLDAEGHRTCFQCGYVEVPAPVAMGEGEEAEGTGVHQPLVSVDRGCKVSPSCLACPLDRCIKDLAPVDQAREVYLHRKLERYRRVLVLAAAGLSRQEIAVEMGVSERTVGRALAWKPRTHVHQDLVLTGRLVNYRRKPSVSGMNLPRAGGSRSPGLEEDLDVA